jgi:DNA-binding XRE family transcriptional regulator
MNTNPSKELDGDKSILTTDFKEEQDNSSGALSVTGGVVNRFDIPVKHRIKVLLERIGRSQNWLADKCDVSKGTMSRIANGEWFPSTTLMERICDVLDVQSHVIFGDSEHWKHYQENIVYPKDGEE